LLCIELVGIGGGVRIGAPSDRVTHGELVHRRVWGERTCCHSFIVRRRFWRRDRLGYKTEKGCYKNERR
jgi:hypothetical protein